MKASTWLRAGALALALATGGAARADQGNAQIDSKDLAQETVVLDGKTYRVSNGTVLEDPNGNAIPFAELPTRAGGASDDDTAAWFETGDESEAQTPVLHVLKLTGRVPR